MEKVTEFISDEQKAIAAAAVTDKNGDSKPPRKKPGRPPKTLVPEVVEDTIDPETLEMSVRMACDSICSISGDAKIRLSDRGIKDQTKAVEIFMKRTGIKPKGAFLDYMMIMSLTYSGWSPIFADFVKATKLRFAKFKLPKFPKKKPAPKSEDKTDGKGNLDPQP